MRPPICALCQRSPRERRHDPAADGEWLSFADYAPLPSGMVGHPRGLEWFCADHVEGARAFSHLRTPEALAAMRAFPARIGASFESRVEPPILQPPPGWRRWLQAMREFF